MSTTPSDSILRLREFMFVQDAELSNINRSDLIKQGMRKVAEDGLRYLIEKCVKVEGGYMGYTGQTLSLDVYVMSPQDFHREMARARMEGERDAQHWNARMDWFTPKEECSTKES
jgi:hypothetical protein